MRKQWLELRQDFRKLFFEKRYDILVADKAIQNTTLTRVEKAQALSSILAPKHK